MSHKLLLALILVTFSLPALSSREAMGYGSTSVTESWFMAKKWDELSDNEKKRIKDAKEKYRKLPSDEQKKLRKKWEKMSPKEREKYKLEKKYR